MPFGEKSKRGRPAKATKALQRQPKPLGPLPEPSPAQELISVDPAPEPTAPKPTARKPAAPKPAAPQTAPKKRGLPTKTMEPETEIDTESDSEQDAPALLQRPKRNRKQ